MSPGIILHTALRSLRRNRLRTGLTLLSLIVGVSAVITIVALGAGARSTIEQEVMSAGTNMVTVSAGNWTSGGVRFGLGSSSRLTEGDATAIRDHVPGVAYVSPGVRSRQQLVSGSWNWSATVEGVGTDLPLIRNWPVAQGSFFTIRDVQAAAKVCVIGTVIRDMLFESGRSPVGQFIRIGPAVFRVVGVLSSKGQSAGGQDQDDAVFIPYTTAQKKLMGVTSLRNILVSARHADDGARISEGIRQLLRYRHEIAPGDSDDFRVRSLEDIVALRTRTTRTMTTLLAVIAAVSLLVGGIGVMNIMLVAVQERTREIGIRLAVGARQRDVRRQFLTEAALISAAGGILGILGGFAISNILSGVLDWPTLMMPRVALGTSLFTAVVGCFFGWYPAQRAARTDPIDALRHE